MKESKLYRLTTVAKNQVNDPDPEIFTFHVMADSPIQALEKLQQLPDIDYMYNEMEDALTITCLGPIYY